jgi:hypothetical protein
LKKPLATRFSHFPCAGIGQCRRRRSSSFISCSFALIRPDRVFRADIQSFFDTVNHEWLIRLVEHRIGDWRIIRLIQKWLRARILEDEAVTVSYWGMGYLPDSWRTHPRLFLLRSTKSWMAGARPPRRYRGDLWVSIKGRRY